MITRHERGEIVWVDLESPTRDELSEVMSEFGINGRVEEEIANSTPYPLTIVGPDYAYLILHFPTTDSAGGARNQEMDFIVGKKFLITCRYEAIESISSLHKVFEAEELLGLPHTVKKSEELLERIMRRMYAALREEVETIGIKLEHIERDIFGGKERRTMRVISEVNRVLLRFDTSLGRHDEALEEFLIGLAEPDFFGKEFRARASHIEAEREHVTSLVRTYRDVAGELRNTNDSLLSVSQNEVMKNLTVITFVILPLTLIAAIFQMRVPGVPLQNQPNAFWIVLVIIATLTALLVLFAKVKRWF